MKRNIVYPTIIYLKILLIVMITLWSAVTKFGILTILRALPYTFLALLQEIGDSPIRPALVFLKSPMNIVNCIKGVCSILEYLSVRENDGSRIIRELTGIDVPVHVDPTLLLTKEQWLAISKQASNKPKGTYVLTYFLGGIPENHRNQIKNMAKANSLEVINLGDIREKETYRTGPGEFIDYINDCALFCTDSFHGAVFSILLRKPFIVYERTDYAMFSRLSTLLEKFNLQSRKIEKIDNIEDAFKIDFSHILTILEAERNKSVDYLRNCLA